MFHGTRPLFHDPQRHAALHYENSRAKSKGLTPASDLRPQTPRSKRRPLARPDELGADRPHRRRRPAVAFGGAGVPAPVAAYDRVCSPDESNCSLPMKAVAADQFCDRSFALTRPNREPHYGKPRVRLRMPGAFRIDLFGATPTTCSPFAHSHRHSLPAIPSMT